MPTLAQLLAGRDPFGSSGGDIMNTMAQARAGGSVDPALSHYIGGQAEGGYSARGSDRLDEGGGITIGGQRFVQVGSIPDDGRIQDYSLVQYDPEFGLITPAENVHVPDSSIDKIMPYLVAAGLGGPAIGAAMGAGEGAAAGAGELVATGGGTAGMGAGVTGSAAMDLGMLGGAAAGGTLPESYWGATADSGGIASDASTGAATTGTTPVLDGGAFDMGGSSGFGGSTYVEPGVGDYISSYGGRAMDAARANPLGAARGIAGLGAVLAGSNSAGGTTSSSGLGNPGDVANIIETMANANRVNQSTPFGSRTWNQGADGRWNATDAFSPEEQANYEGVRGMNANVTDFAMQKLAALMAKPSQSHSAPFQWNGRTIGG